MSKRKAKVPSLLQEMDRLSQQFYNRAMRTPPPGSLTEVDGKLIFRAPKPYKASPQMEALEKRAEEILAPEATKPHFVPQPTPPTSK